MPDMTGIQTRVDKRGNQRYRGYVKDRGKKIFGPWGDNYADARGWRIKAMAAKLDAPLAQASTQTIAEAAEKFLQGAQDGVILSRKRRAYAPKTVRSYRQAFDDWILPELGHIGADKLRRSQVQRWVDWLSSQRAGGTTRNTFHALAALYSWLLPRHDDMVDPTDGVLLPAPAEHRERYASPLEMAALLDALPGRLALPYALAFYAGLRHAEIQALRWEDIGDEWITVSRALDPIEGFKAPKSGKPREIPIFDTLKPYLGERTSGLLLPSRYKSRWGTQTLGTPFLEQCKDYWSSAGLQPIGLHEGRHSFATALVRAGYDVKLVQEWVGHADPTTTLRIYAKERGREGGLTDRMNTYLGG